MSGDPKFHENALAGWCQQLPPTAGGVLFVFKEADIWQNNVLLDLCDGKKLKTRTRETKTMVADSTLCFKWKFLYCMPPMTVPIPNDVSFFFFSKSNEMRE